MAEVLNLEFWNGKRIFLTGHTGFKGAWLSFWLSQMGAKVTGFALKPDQTPSLFDLLELQNRVTHIVGDICDNSALERALFHAKPDIVIHMAAQPIVSIGYEQPSETFLTNVQGTVNVLDACRRFNQSLQILVISSDKCYLNDDGGRLFKVGDHLGGFDPYSASKACTEIVSHAYAGSFFGANSNTKLATARAGNVVGGGDWSLNRLLPDGARSFSKNEPFMLRNPIATRPWQHVLEPLYGYLTLVQAMSKEANYARSWNFGPPPESAKSVEEVAKLFANYWGAGTKIEISPDRQNWHEASVLQLDCSETNIELGWKPVLGLAETIEWTASWYRRVYADQNAKNVQAITLTQIEKYMDLQQCQS